jgi:hypothetical protein
MDLDFKRKKAGPFKDPALFLFYQLQNYYFGY